MTVEKILCVDDDPVILYGLQRDLRSRFTLVLAQSGEEAIRLLKTEGPFAVILADMMMPGMNGLELLGQAQRIAPDTVRIMHTADDEKQTAVEAINEGRIFRFLSKPCSREKQIEAIRAALEYYRLICAERELLDETLNDSVKMLTELLAMAEPETFGRGQKVREYVRIAAPAVELEHTWDVEVAAMLAQIGFMTIPPQLVQKLQADEELSPEEKEMVERVPEIGFKVLSKIRRLGPAAQLVLYQSDQPHAFETVFEPIKSQRMRRAATLLRILTELVRLESTGAAKWQAFQQLRADRRFNADITLFDQIAEAVLSQDSPAKKRHSVSLKELEPGMQLHAAVQTKDGRLLAPAGTVVSSMLLERLHNFAGLSGIVEPIEVKKS